MDRWTMDELRQTDDLTFAISILDERRNKLNRYSPLSLKLQEAQRTLRDIKQEKDRFIAAISAATEPGEKRDPADEGPDTAQMTEEEYTAHRIEQSRRALMELIAKVEHPTGDELSDILVKAVNDIEALQEADE